MKVLVKPVYGFGWRTSENPTAIKVLREFPVDLEVVESSSPFNAAMGLVTEPDHLLTGLWVVLEQRTGGNEPHYNLNAYNQKPLLDGAQKPSLTGFAMVLPIPN